MAIMGSSNLRSSTLYDPIRKKWVEKTPEECIRQLLILHMIEQLGYPPALIAVERELSSFKGAQEHSAVPKRRVDILVFNKSSAGALTPLLMIECKAVALTPKFTQQLVGYNSFIGAPFIALANGKDVLTGHYDGEQYRFQPGLPHWKTTSQAIVDYF